jgi:hypothetical protein
VRQVDDGYVVETAHGIVAATRVVSTIPLNRVTALCGIQMEQLPGVTLLSLFYSFVGERGFNESIVYNFSQHARWKRLTMYSDFYGQVDGRDYFGVEVVADDTVLSTEAAAQEFRDHTAVNNLFRGDLRLEGGHVLTEAYPVYTGASNERAIQAVAELRAFGVESFGRQGAFRYQPTARVSTTEAEAALADNGSSAQVGAG